MKSVTSPLQHIPVRQRVFLLLYAVLCLQPFLYSYSYEISTTRSNSISFPVLFCSPVKAEHESGSCIPCPSLKQINLTVNPLSYIIRYKEPLPAAVFWLKCVL